MKPASHREQNIAGCANCRHAGTQPNLHPELYLLCYHGDAEAEIRDSLGTEAGDWLDRWWSRRLVDGTDVCDHYEQGSPKRRTYFHPEGEPTA